VAKKGVSGGEGMMLLPECHETFKTLLDESEALELDIKRADEPCFVHHI